MSVLKGSETEREARMWWVIAEDGLPVHVEGLRCTPHNPDAWYFPSKGFSIHESGVYEDEVAALVEASRRLLHEQHEIRGKLDQISRRIVAA